MTPMFRIPAKAFAASAVCAMISSCSDGALSIGSGGAAAGNAVPASVAVLDASVFRKTDKALWDGRPSLGGVWIAHPDAATIAEHVEIRNNETGKAIESALFNRARDLPGPAFQLSADAAVALGATAGFPVSVTVTAFRREPVAPPPQAATEAAVIAEDPALVAADAAIDEVPEPASDAAAPDETAVSRPGSFFGSRPKNTGVNAPVEHAIVSPEEGRTAPETAEPLAAGEIAETLPEPRPGSAGSAGSGPGSKPTLVDDAGLPIPLDGSSLQPITATEILSVPLPEATAEVPAATLETVMVAEPEPASAIATDLERPFVQVASGSNKANVKELAAKLVAEGLPAIVRETTQDGKPLFYVVVGPAASEADLNANLAKIRELGYPDAFIAKG